ncbi:hypothetical protein ACFXJO_12660 [Streptomyces lavendulae]|uniref:hypothetical protein n=1 Tax=Streptomyces lavendulae TaxID=1914 RepID=UPI0036A58968
MEALEPDELQHLVLAAVDPYIDREEQQRRALEESAPNEGPSQAEPVRRPWPRPGGSAAPDGAAHESVGSHAEGADLCSRPEQTAQISFSSSG